MDSPTERDFPHIWLAPEIGWLFHRKGHPPIWGVFQTRGFAPSFELGDAAQNKKGHFGFGFGVDTTKKKRGFPHKKDPPRVGLFTPGKIGTGGSFHTRRTAQHINGGGKAKPSEEKGL